MQFGSKNRLGTHKVLFEKQLDEYMSLLYNTKTFELKKQWQFTLKKH